jgi:hypothetical protein
MLLSTLHEQVKQINDALLDSSVFLAAPDMVPGDDVDVYLASIAEVRVDLLNNQITLIPASETEPVETNNPILSLRILLEQMPSDARIWGEFEIKVELPLNRDASERTLKSVESVAEFHIGLLSEEAWLLVRPNSEFSAGMLPT